MSFEKRFEPSKEMLQIKAILENAPPGAYLSYDDIEKGSKVPMDLRGKSLLRSACRSLKLAYRCDRGSGIELEAPGNAMSIVTTQVKRVDNGLKRTGKVSRRLQDRYLEQMSDEDRPRLTAVVSLLGAISAVAGGLKRLYSEKPEALNTVSSNKIPWKP